MDTKYVVIIVGNGWTENQVRQECKEEEYPHMFYFSDGILTKDMQKAVDFSDEVWIFGYVTNDEVFGYANESGKDIWNMG